jgi:hypothetical protein
MAPAVKVKRQITRAHVDMKDDVVDIFFSRKLQKFLGTWTYVLIRIGSLF